MGWHPLREAAAKLGINRKALFARGKRGTWDTRDGDGETYYWVPEAEDATVIDTEEGSAIEDLARLAGSRPAPVNLHQPKTDRRARDLKCAAVLCDWHVPVHHLRFTDAVIDWIEEHQPETVIINGDFVDLESASSHGGNASPPKLLEEMQHGNAMLDRLQAAAPAAAWVYNMGNHETRLQRSITKLIPTLHGAIEIGDLLHLEARGFRVNGYMVGEMLGAFEVVHGKWCPKNYAAKYLRDYGAMPGGGVAIGHTHRPQMITKSDRGGYRAVYGFGHGHDEAQAHYLDKNPSDWVMGFGVVYYEDMPGGRWAAYPVMAPDGRFVWAGRVYGD